MSPTTAEAGAPRNAAASPDTAIAPSRPTQPVGRTSSIIAAHSALAPMRSELRRPTESVCRPEGTSAMACTAVASRNPRPTRPTPRSRDSVTKSGTSEIRRPKTMNPLVRLTMSAAR